MIHDIVFVLFVAVAAFMGGVGGVLFAEKFIQRQNDNYLSTTYVDHEAIDLQETKVHDDTWE